MLDSLKAGTRLVCFFITVHRAWHRVGAYQILTQ